MAKIAIVQLSDLHISSKYEADDPSQSQYGGPWGNWRLFKHVAIPENVDPECAVASLDEEDQVVISADSALVSEKTQAMRDYKLWRLRELRAEKFVAIDLWVNDLLLGMLQTEAAAEVRDYRTALKNVTTAYKDSGDSSKGASTIDSINVEAFDWPTKPVL